jgi:hypothetical protein
MLKVSMKSDYMLPSQRFDDSSIALVDSVPVGPHLTYLHENFNEEFPRFFYRDLFPLGELDEEGEFNKGKYTAIAIRIFEKENKVHRYSVCDDLFVIDKLCHCNEFCVMAPVSFAGKSQRQANARNLYAIVFDLDGLLVTDDGQSKSLINLFAHIELGLIPRPTYIVFSGTGLHLYYMLNQPLPLFPNVMKSVSKYRTNLIKKLWNPYITSLYEKPQFESVTQGFRMVGTRAKHGRTVRAFKTGDKVDIEYLNQFADSDSKIDLVKYVSKTPKSVAKEKWPEWYEQRIVQGQPRGTWNIKRDLYDWWKRKIEEGAVVGHRYFCVMALAVYARKCGISYEELEKDALGIVPFLNGLDETGGQPFTTSDVVKALEAYDVNYITFPRHTIEELTGIVIPPNKRNGRRQELHLKLCRANLEVLNADNGAALQGRPKGSGEKKNQVYEWRHMNPSGTKAQCVRETGISKPTVLKWWDWVPDKLLSQ